MPIIRVSDVTYQEIARLTTPGRGFRSTGERQSDGSWLVPIEDDTWERLQAQRLPGESDDEVVMRLIRFYHGRRPS